MAKLALEWWASKGRAPLIATLVALKVSHGQSRRQVVCKCAHKVLLSSTSQRQQSTRSIVLAKLSELWNKSETTSFVLRVWIFHSHTELNSYNSQVCLPKCQVSACWPMLKKISASLNPFRTAWNATFISLLTWSTFRSKTPYKSNVRPKCASSWQKQQGLMHFKNTNNRVVPSELAWKVIKRVQLH
jgi:hypothetical protein